MELIDNTTGQYRFLKGIAPYSAGVVAMPGAEIVHAILRQPLPYREGFNFIAGHLASLNRPLQALCAIELRSPAPFSFEGFAQFNGEYHALLVERDLLINGLNPIARTNVAPDLDAPAEPVLSGFAYTIQSSAGRPPTFVVAGAGDLRDQILDTSAIIRRGEATPDALREKADDVMTTMLARLAGLDVAPDTVTSVNLYTVYPIESFLQAVILQQLGGLATSRGVNWLFSRPPIMDLAFEMDLRGVCIELVVS